MNIQALYQSMSIQPMTPFQLRLKHLMDEYVHFVYTITRSFPKEEMYGCISQFRRSALSVILNYVEGYARFHPRQRYHFYEIAYASLHESLYLFDFSCAENWVSEEHGKTGRILGNEIGAMLWSEIQKVK